MPDSEALDILRDLAVVMVVAGGVLLLFHRLRQPVILGYLLAGVIIGPHTPPFPLVREIAVVNVLADIGIILLMYSLGLEFSLKRLRRVGKVALIGGALQVLIVFTLGYQAGLLLGWGDLTAIFLGAGLSISSTALIVKVLQEQRRVSDQASQAVFGILVFEDFAAIAMITLLSGFGTTTTVNLQAIGLTLLKVLLFASLSILLGLSIIPRLMDYVTATGRRELSVVVGLALCFGMAVFSRSLGLSVAAGAFMAGALVSEARQSEVVARTMEPIKDMFAALFFVAIGMLLNPVYLRDFWPHILLLTLLLIVGKIVAGTVATFLLGYGHHTAIRVGMSLAQIGEFSLILAKVGQDSGVTADFLYPVIVGVTGLSALTTPYLIQASFRPGERLDSALSPRLRRYLHSAESALQRLQSLAGAGGAHGGLVRRSITGILVNALLLTVVMAFGRLAYENWRLLARLTPIPPAGLPPALGFFTLALAAFPLVAIVPHARHSSPALWPGWCFATR